MAKDTTAYFRTGFRFVKSDMDSFKKLQRALEKERGGPVTLTDTIREAIRFRIAARAAAKA